ncbi:hypothetical protein CBR_g40842 [Chara braunii]|uniref:Uncharacterized protein n=1 Tax=Chara braunii TaxID=69332 RepID=A0A388K2G5_CHABU|nr:hypothetical protein CBR_g40842 [Chara braunii]|eukprot:GBG64143.1 hypothetical protein CBR_g40842 [Chara braunii]
MKIPLLVVTNNLLKNIFESPVRDLGLTISLRMVRRGEAELSAVYLVEPSSESAGKARVTVRYDAQRHKPNGVLDVTHRWDAGVRERRWENVVVLSDEVTNCGLQVSCISCEFLSVSVSERRRGGLDGRRRDGSRDGSHGDRGRIWLQRDELSVRTGWIIV